MSGSLAYPLSMLYVVQTVLFTALLLMLFPRRKDAHIWSWANALSAASVAFVANPIESVSVWLASLSGAVTMFGAALRILAYGASDLRKRRAALPVTAALATVICGLMLVVFPDTQYKLLLLSVGGILSSMASIYLILTNRAWVGMTAKWISVVTLLFAIGGISTRAITAYPFGRYTTFMTDNSQQELNLILLLLFTFAVQISFLALIAERHGRDQIFLKRRQVRLRATAGTLIKDRQQIAEVAAERMSLLRMLTHEVRQPLNNAQAVLQSIIVDLSSGIRSSALLLEMADRAQRTVSDVVLAISNSIIGATLISATRQPDLHPAELNMIARLAVLDIDPADRTRILEHHHHDVIFAQVDPVLLRLAIRNLLENALKFSPRGENVMFDIDIDDHHMVATFSVRNTVMDQSLIIDDMFGFERRGSDSRYSGMGLGLFIVKRCADLHHGQIVHSLDEANSIRFELSIPC
jgi:signal transduction histidine kinase